MVARGFLATALVFALCACASTSSPTTPQNSLYVVGDNAAASNASLGSGAIESQGQFSVIKRIYWFFAGR